jgi:acid stress-induced BolA-like protein IbaG/YrbA
LTVQENEECCELHLTGEPDHFFANIVGHEVIGVAFDNEES